MKTIPINLDDELAAALESVCAKQGRDKTDVVTDIVREYVEIENLKSMLQDPVLVTLYQQLASEDLALAEEGIGEYQQTVEAADRT